MIIADVSNEMSKLCNLGCAMRAAMMRKPAAQAYVTILAVEFHVPSIVPPDDGHFKFFTTRYAVAEFKLLVQFEFPEKPSDYDFVREYLPSRSVPPDFLSSQIEKRFRNQLDLYFVCVCTRIAAQCVCYYVELSRRRFYGDSATVTSPIREKFVTYNCTDAGAAADLLPQISSIWLKCGSRVNSGGTTDISAEDGRGRGCETTADEFVCVCCVFVCLCLCVCVRFGRTRGYPTERLCGSVLRTRHTHYESRDGILDTAIPRYPRYFIVSHENIQKYRIFKPIFSCHDYGTVAAWLKEFCTPEAYKRRVARGDRHMRIKSLIASTRKALNWRAVLSSITRLYGLRNSAFEARERYGRQFHASLAPHRSYAQHVPCSDIPGWLPDIPYHEMSAFLIEKLLKIFFKCDRSRGLQLKIIHTATQNLPRLSKSTESRDLINAITRFGRLLTSRSSEPMRVIDVRTEQRRNEGAGGNGRTLRKPADQRHRPARFPHAKIRSYPAGD
ncbi:hypothetical protein PR048_000365 [Dryococelus australis]|uniref:Uncharacterized protein n=1 Tax=Dryococelus australis TaxID=614101 RepID=A0ABQ9IFA6_9NEOP|nr:hypothetical protein PR048_000365 [Dryococelus australis]